MALGSRGYKDFGLSGSMTLPITTEEHGTSTAGAFMPEAEEKKKNTKRARFAMEHNQEREFEVIRKKSWASRFKGLFKRSKKRDDRSHPYVVDTPPVEDVMAQSESDPDPSPARREEEEEVLRGREVEASTGGNPELERRKHKSDRKAKALSTGFEHISPAPVELGALSSVHVTLRPKSSRSVHKLVLHHREEGLGLSLSGGHPPVTVIHVLTGGIAESAGVSVGDTILDINGLNCRKKVDISRLMELKVIQRSMGRKDASHDYIDGEAWGKIKTMQDELESESSNVVITKLDSATEDEVPNRAAAVEVRGKRRSKGSKKRHSSSKLAEAELGLPLAASSPLANEEEPKPRRKKKRDSRHSLTGAGDSNGEVSGKRASRTLTGAGDSKGEVSGKRASRTLTGAGDSNGEVSGKRASRSLTGAGDSNGEVSGKRASRSLTDTPGKSAGVAVEKDESNGKRKVSKRNSRSITEASEEGRSSPREKTSPREKKSSLKEKSSPREKSSKSSLKERSSPRERTSPEEKKKKKRKSLKSGEPSKVSTASVLSSSDIVVFDVEVATLREETEDQPLLKQESISVDVEMDRGDRNRRSNSPKSRYHMGEGEGEGEGEQQVTIGVVKKKKKSKKTEEVSIESKKSKKAGDVTVERKNSKGKKSKKAEVETSKDDSKKSKKKSTKKRRKSSEAERPFSTVEVPAEASLSNDALAASMELSHSAAISGSIESNTLTFVSKGNSKSSSSLRHSASTTMGQQEQQEQPAEEELEKGNTLPRRKRSTDHGKVSNPAFREELREASKSQHDMSDVVTIEIDPNIKIKRSGQIKEGKTPVRPSIFDQSSSPEPDEATTPISSGPVEDNILNSELKVKRSGLMVGKKTTPTARPSILETQKSAEKSPTDILPGEMKYNRKVNEEVVDLSVIPITPTLGCVAERDRRDASNRSLTKRRPASMKRSLFLDSRDGEIRGTERVELSPPYSGRKPAAGKGISDVGSSGGFSAARKLFENSPQPKTRFGKPTENPVKAVAMPQYNRKPAETPEKKITATAIPSVGTKGDEPSWLTIAQGRLNKASVIEKKEPAARSSPPPRNQENTAPQSGHVAQRLAMFQKS